MLVLTRPNGITSHQNDRSVKGCASTAVEVSDTALDLAPSSANPLSRLSWQTPPSVARFQA